VLDAIKQVDAAFVAEAPTWLPRSQIQGDQTGIQSGKENAAFALATGS
jgi:hypothetical protein